MKFYSSKNIFCATLVYSRSTLQTSTITRILCWHYIVVVIIVVTVVVNSGCVVPTIGYAIDFTNCRLVPAAIQWQVPSCYVYAAVPP